MNKKIAVIIFAITIGVLISRTWAAQQAAVQNHSITGDITLTQWQFEPAPEAADFKSGPLANGWGAVKLPFIWTSAWHLSENIKELIQKTSWGHGHKWSKIQHKLDDCDNGWFEKKVTIPSSWQGRRVWLYLSDVACDAFVWANGQPAGLINGPEGRVDLTGLVKPGQTATLRVWVTRWWEGIKKTRKDSPLRDIVLKKYAHHFKDGIRTHIPAGIPGHVILQSRPVDEEITNVFVQTSVQKHELRVCVSRLLEHGATGNKVSIRVFNAAGNSKHTINSNQPILQTIVPLQNESPGKHSRTVVIPWRNPILWEVGQEHEHLYRLDVVLLNAHGKIIQRYKSIRFGFREIWTDGKKLILNGHPLRLRTANLFTQSWPAMVFYRGMGFNTIELQPNPSAWYATWGMRPALMGSAERLAWTRHPVSIKALHMADQRGWALLMPAPSLSSIRGHLHNPKVFKAYRRWMQLWMKHLQNHPSILMWCAAMNTGSWGRGKPDRIGTRDPGVPSWNKKAAQLLHQLDPTRPVYLHSGRGGDMEYPNQYLNFMPLQEREDFPRIWAKNGNKPWGIAEHGVLFSADFAHWHKVPQFTEYLAIYQGDNAYRNETDSYLKMANKHAGHLAHGIWPFSPQELSKTGPMSSYLNLVGQFISSTNRAWRAYGVAGGWFPWTFYIGYGLPPGGLDWQSHSLRYAYGRLPVIQQYAKRIEQSPATTEPLPFSDHPPKWANPLYKANRQTMQPLLVYLGGRPKHFTAKGHSYFSGQSFDKTIVAVWDGPGSKTFSAHWQLKLSNQVIASGEYKFDMTAGQIKKVPVHLRAPHVLSRTDGRLMLVVKNTAGKIISKDQLQLSFWPVVRQAHLSSRWAIFDPEHQSTAWLKKMGVTPVVIHNRAQLLKANTNVLIVGRKALAGGQPLPFHLSDVQNGLRVLMLEQTIDSLNALGFRAEDTRSRYVFAQVKDNPILKGIERSDLINWRGESSFFPPGSGKTYDWPAHHAPHAGNQGTVASVVIETPHRGAFTPILVCGYDLAYSPLLQWRSGKGGVIFCQLDLRNRIGTAPVATQLARQLLINMDRAGQWSKYPQNRTANYTGDSDGWNYLQSIGMSAKRLGSDGWANLNPASDVLVIGPDAWPQVSRDARIMQSFVSRGGNILVLPQSEKAFKEAAGIFNLKVQPEPLARVIPTAKDAPVLRGIGPELLHYRKILPFQAFSSSNQSGRRLLDGLLLVVPSSSNATRSAGKWVFSQIDWRLLNHAKWKWNLHRPRVNTRKFYRQILTNLQVASSNQVAEKVVTPQRYAPMVNIPDWRIAGRLYKIPTQHTKDNVLPGLATKFALPPVNGTTSSQLEKQGIIGEGEVARGVIAPVKGHAWLTWGPRPNGEVHLDWVNPVAPKLGLAGYATSWIYSSRPRKAVFSLGMDYWMIFKVNGKIYLNQAVNPRPRQDPSVVKFRIAAPLKTGWNKVEVKVASGSSGFGFWCMVSNPGDIRFSAAAQPPRATAAQNPPAKSLLAEPPLHNKPVFYTRRLTSTENPYFAPKW